jgi:hypothetical protein
MDGLDQDWLIIELQSIDQYMQRWSDGIKESFATLIAGIGPEKNAPEPSSSYNSDPEGISRLP